MSHVCHGSFQGPHDTLSDHRLWVVVLNTLHLVAPLLIRHLGFARCHITTKGAYLWGANLQTQCWAFMSCPISGPASAEPGDCSSGPEGTLPPPGKVTSWSSSSGTPLPNGCAQSLGGGLLGGAVNLCCTISCKRSLTSCQSSKLFRSPS